MSDCFVSTSDNQPFLKKIKDLVTKSGYKLKICEPFMNRGDRWIQVRTLSVSLNKNPYLAANICRDFLTANWGEMLTH